VVVPPDDDEVGPVIGNAPRRPLLNDSERRAWWADERERQARETPAARDDAPAPADLDDQSRDPAVPGRPAEAAPVAPASSPAAGVVIWGAVSVLGVIGAYLSFFTVRDSDVGRSFGPNAWALPVLIDVGILAFTALDLRMTAQQARSGAVRLFPWFLNGTTVYLNAVEQPTWAGRIAHGAPPILWIAAVEAAAMMVHRHVAGPKVTPDRVPVALWLLAPGPTLLFWRRMRKQGITSYAQAWERDKHRRLVRARLRREFGRWAWRWSAPEEQLELFKLGELVAIDVDTEIGASPLPARRAQSIDDAGDATATPAALPTGADPTAERDTGRASTSPSRRPTARVNARGASSPSPRVAELTPLAVEIARDHDGRLNRDQLKAALAARGEGAGGSTLAQLMHSLKEAGHVR
jgi:hypothetical protein